MRGVKKSGNKFTSKVMHKGTLYYLGTFDTEEEAYTAYTLKKEELTNKSNNIYLNISDVFIYKEGFVYNKHTGHKYEAINSSGYIEVRFNREKRIAHRIIWELFNGSIPLGMQIDHKDGNKLNNNIDNLRLATPMQNSANTLPKNKDLPKGVSKVGNKFIARIHYQYSNIHIGTFATIEEAAEAYNNKAKELHGEFAYCNRE